VGDAGSGLAEDADVSLAEVDAVRAPHVGREPVQRRQVLDRSTAVELAAVGLLLDRLR
jgi:hypothetical protein